MTSVDDFETDEQVAARLRRSLHAVAETVTDDDVAALLTPIDLPSRRSRRFPRRFAVAGVAAAVVAGALLVVQSYGPSEGRAWAAEAVAVAEAAPRVLVTEDGWEVTRADEFSIELGEVTFTGPADEELTVGWGTGTNGGYEDRVEEWSNDAQRLDDVTLAGHEAAVFQTSGQAGSHFVAVWADGEYGVEVRGDFPDAEAFVDLAVTIEPVDVDTWLSAMPATVVKPESRATAVQQMLVDIPVPAGFDPDDLASGSGSVSDRYQLGADVSSRVACAWIGQWVDATRTGDAAAAQEAVEAMATSHGWDILLEMEDQGGWSPGVWEYADAIATDGTIDAGAPDIPVADSYVEALGCTTR